MQAMAVMATGMEYILRSVRVCVAPVEREVTRSGDAPTVIRFGLQSLPLP